MIYSKQILILLYTGLLILVGTNLNGQRIAQFCFDEQSGVNTTIDSVSQVVFNINNQFSRPERITGIFGNALRLDGYSTWASNETYQLNGIVNQMTISTWYSTEAFNYGNPAIISQINSNKGFSLDVGPYGNVILEFYVNGDYYFVETEKVIPKYVWNYIVATIDLPNNQASIWVNGEQWSTGFIRTNSSFELSQTPLYIGKHSKDSTANGFLISASNGAIDEIDIYKNILTDSVIRSMYQAHSTVVPDLNINPAVRMPETFYDPNTMLCLMLCGQMSLMGWSIIKEIIIYFSKRTLMLHNFFLCIGVI